MTPFQKKLFKGLIVMALLSPLGIILPEAFQAGDAWGEWGTDALETLLGYVPAKLKELSGLWTPPVPDYNIGPEGSPLAIQIVSYVISGIMGISIVASVIFLITRIIRPGDGK